MLGLVMSMVRLSAGVVGDVGDLFDVMCRRWASHRLSQILASTQCKASHMF